MIPVCSPKGGIFRRLYNPGDEVKCGDVLALIYDPLRGDEKSKITAPKDGIIFFCHKSPMVTEHQLCFFLQECSAQSELGLFYKS